MDLISLRICSDSILYKYCYCIQVESKLEYYKIDRLNFDKYNFMSGKS